jgi:hypothetical protein
MSSVFEIRETNINLHGPPSEYTPTILLIPIFKSSTFLILLLITFYTDILGARDGAVVESQRYKPEGRGIDSRWCHWNCSLT